MRINLSELHNDLEARDIPKLAKKLKELYGYDKRARKMRRNTEEQ